jgi:hypothetical protein
MYFSTQCGLEHYPNQTILYLSELASLVQERGKSEEEMEKSLREKNNVCK